MAVGWSCVIPLEYVAGGRSTFERVLSLLIFPRFEARWARDGEDGEDDTYDRFIEGSQ